MNRKSEPFWEPLCPLASCATAQRNYTNTGLLCGDLVGVDIDALDVSLAARRGA